MGGGGSEDIHHLLDIVSVHRAEIRKTQFFKEDSGDYQIFKAILQPVKVTHGGLTELRYPLD